MRELIQQRDVFRQSASEAVTAAKQLLMHARAAEAGHARTLGKLVDRGVEPGDAAYEVTDKKLNAATQASRAAQTDLATAERFAQSHESAWQRLSAAIHETRNLAAAWEGARPEERRILLDYWVHHVLIVVEPIPGMKRANHKTAIVTLRTAPGAPRYFELSTGQSTSARTADSSSSRTRASGSTAWRARRKSQRTRWGSRRLPSGDWQHR